MSRVSESTPSGDGFCDRDAFRGGDDSVAEMTVPLDVPERSRSDCPSGALEEFPPARCPKFLKIVGASLSTEAFVMER
jgi:hypothetical protein